MTSARRIAPIPCSVVNDRTPFSHGDVRPPRRRVSVLVAGALVATLATSTAGFLATSAGAAGHASATARAVAPRTLGPGDHTLYVNSGGRQRQLILHVPYGSTVANRPLLLVYPGALDTAKWTAANTDFEQASNSTRGLVAFLQGYQNSWNAGAGVTPAGSAHVDDVAFTTAAINYIETLVPFSHTRISATGLSNGALMTDYLGCRLAKRLAMIAPVEGPLPVNVSKSCAPARAIAVYEIHGTSDGAIPYNGGTFSGVWGGTVTVLSAKSAVGRWAHLDACSSKPANTAPSSWIRLTTYSKCHRTVKATLRTIIGGVHQWGSDVGKVVFAALPK
jgi:polyhydroxybutyrate depolymerase